MNLEEDHVQDMLEQAVYQQLFCSGEGERIMGKNPEYTMQYTGIEKLLDEFIEELRVNLPKILDLKIADYLKVFEKRFGVDLSTTEDRILTNFEGMGGLEFVKDQPTMLIYMVLTKMIEAIREYGYAKWGRGRIIEQYEEFSGKKFTKKIDEKINNLAALNNRSISLLYNLSFITLLNESYAKGKDLTTAKRLTTMKVNTIVKKHLI